VTERIAITRIGHRGDGVADTPDGPVYVSFALPGETVEVERFPGHPDRRQLLRVETASADRVAPICPHFGTCGGCAVQHWTEARYRTWKRDILLRALAQAGIDAPVDDLVDAHGDGRRRIVLHARRGTHDVLEVGFSAARAHNVVAIDRCPILAPGLGGAIEVAWAIAEVLEGTGKPLDIQATATDAGLDIDVRGSGLLTAAHSAALARIAEAHRLVRVTRHGELVAQRSAPTVRMGKAIVALPPGAFLQATEAGEAALTQRAVSHCDGARTIADLFCGVGPFALRLAERAKVTAVDDDASAIAALKRAAAATSGLKPVEAEARDLFRRPLLTSELARFDAVVFDPPRQGAEAQARALAESKAPRVVAVSCNPATFARDASHLLGGGYKLTALTPIDQFRYSFHVEIVARFEK
jgi:23S rRNA (uracil1939-C5)-methyltransferase